jgi:general stress protein YciG
VSGTAEGNRKRAETLRKKHGEDYLRESAINAAKHSPGGFASNKIGKDGLTGKERAQKAGRKGGLVSPTSFDNDPERAKRLSHEYWDKQKGKDNEDS